MAIHEALAGTDGAIAEPAAAFKFSLDAKGAKRGEFDVTNQGVAEIVVFDARELRVTARWPLKPCEEPTGLAGRG
jgi:hypothetical protein